MSDDYKDKYINQLTDEDSLKSYPDLKNSIDNAGEDGKIEGEIRGKFEIAKEMIKDGEPMEKVMRYCYSSGF